MEPAALQAVGSETQDERRPRTDSCDRMQSRGTARHRPPHVAPPHQARPLLDAHRAALRVAELRLTLLGGTLYLLLGACLGATHAHPLTLFRKFVSASAEVVVRDNSLTMRFGSQAHNPC